MISTELMEKYLDIAAKIGTYSRSKEHFRFYLNYLFQRTSFNEKSMLDIGGGSGLYSFYGSIKGAKEVICLEPELEGSTKFTLDNFNQLSSSLLLGNVVLLRETFQEYDPDDKTFEIILLHNSINHLDEEACIKLQYDKDAQNRYKSIFKKLSKLASPRAKLIITDCSPNNFFALLGITNPLASTIDWNKHQSPEYWSNMLSNYGFVNPKIRWTSFSFLRDIGRFLIGNRFASYFLNSHFCLTMEKSACARRYHEELKASNIKNLNIIYFGPIDRGKIELEAIGAKVFSPPHSHKIIPNIISLQKYIKKFKPDAILIDAGGLINLIMLLLGKINNLPYFVVIRGNYKEEFKQLLPLEDNLLKKIRSIIYFKFYFFSIRRAKAIFTNSNYLNKKIRYQLDMPQKEIITVYPTIDLRKFHPHHNPHLFKNLLDLSQETRILLTVMNFTFPLKVGGLIYFIETIGEVLNKYKNLKYVIAGDGPLKYLIERKIEKIGLKDSILLPGFVREIEKAYASSEFIIHTSFLDMTPVVILEAGASGKPVIINKCGGMPELVSNGNTGFIVGKTDREELKEKIIELLENNKLRHNMSINARKMIEKKNNRKKTGNIYSKKIKDYSLPR